MAVTAAPQTTEMQWMQAEQVPGCPPGLEYLTKIDQLLVHQQVELLEAFTGWETNNRYKVKNSLGQQVYFAHEESDMCMRQCCGPHRSFTIHITDNNNQEVIRVTREFKCCAGCCWCASMDCCGYEVKVEAPIGTTIGYVRQWTSGWKPHYVIQDANREKVLSIWGPCCICQGLCCQCDVDFNVYGSDDQTIVGKITKQWAGLAKEMFTDADVFGISFPMDLDVKAKATMLAACLLVDFMFFEESNNDN